MSNPVTNADIEDVLSSIRRLVSEDTRFDTRPPPAKPAEDENRLILTPSQRVVEQDAPIVDDAFEENESVDLSGPENAAPEPWETPGATLHAAAAHAARETEAEVFTLTANLRKDLPPAAELEEAEVHADVSQEADGDMEQGEETVVSSEAMDDVPAVSEPQEQIDQPSDDTAEQALEQDITQDDGPAETEVQAMAETPLEDQSQQPETDAVEASADDAGDTTSLAQKIQALEAAVGGAREDWEHEDASDQDWAKTETIAWRDHIDHVADKSAISESVAEETPAQDTVPPEEVEMPDPQMGPTDETKSEAAPEAPLFDEEETILDEDALRELVADIVRQELQGALGERITRNVRKLVRREIHRALTTQDL